MQADEFAVALVHAPVLNRKGVSSATAITPMDVHDFARTAAFYGVNRVFMVHPAEAMHQMVDDLTGYWQTGEGGVRNRGRKEVLQSIEMLHGLEEAQEMGYQLWFTSANPPEGAVRTPSELPNMAGKHLLVFGTAWGLDVQHLPQANGWLSPIDGIGKVRHLSVRAALAIYLDRLCMS